MLLFFGCADPPIPPPAPKPPAPASPPAPTYDGRLLPLVPQPMTVEPCSARADGVRGGEDAYVIHGGEVRATTPSGRARAQATLAALALAKANANAKDVGCVHVEDAPRFPFRAMHLDVARHFFPKDVVKRYVDLLAFYKFNYFHWHLTDDQGFRLELKKHPELTRIGGADGFYSQEDVREVVAFAKERGVTVIPEIEMPGHARALLAAHPELSCTGKQQEVPRTWGVFDDVMCPGNDATLALASEILDEVVELFPGPYVHVGGDEVQKTRWSQCPKCAARMKTEHVDIEHLEGWFMERVAKMVTARGRRAIVWDEALDDRLPKDVVVVAWQSFARGVDAAKAGHDVVMAPYEWVYFNYRQSKTNAEPGHPGHTPWSRVRSFDPTAFGAEHVIGGEGLLWTEYVTSQADIDTLVAPRIAALADVLWSPPGNADSFPARFILHRPLLDARGIAYFVEPPDLGPAKRVFLDRMTVAVTPSPLFADGELRGVFPPIVDATIDLSAQTVLANGRTSPVVTARREKQRPRPALETLPFEGVRYRYFEGDFAKLPDFARLTPKRTGTMRTVTLLDAFRKEGFAVTYATHVTAKADGVYRFTARGDDGVRVFVDDELVVEDDGEHAPRDADGEIALGAGFHTMRVEYFQGAGGKELSVKLTGPVPVD